MRLLSTFSGIGGLELGLERAGMTVEGQDERWGWPWMADLIRTVGPRYVVVENVPALIRDRDAFGWVLGDLADLGFDAEWEVLSACSFGAPHPRERLFLVAYPAVERPSTGGVFGAGPASLESLRRSQEQGGPWTTQPRPVGVAYGVPRGMDRRGALGNAVVPVVAEYVGRSVMAHALEAA